MPTDISRDIVQELMAEGAQLIDVRPDKEFQEEHIAGAINLPLKTLDATTAGLALERSRPVVVY